MSRVVISTLVEGQGEVAAVPVLLRRMATEIAPELWVDLPRPYRIGRGGLLAPGGVERAVAALAMQSDPGGAVLVLVDADDDCPADLGPRLLDRIATAGVGGACSVVVANREFEAWFIAAAPSLQGKRGLASELPLPADPERPRDCKGWLSEHRVDKRSYKPAADQAALAAAFDLHMARKNAPSFDKLWRDLERLLREAADGPSR